LRAFDEKVRVRITYDRGVLEIMSPLLEHDHEAWFLGRLVMSLTQELGLPIQCGGSVTLRKKLVKKGVEPDACFWIANAARIAGKRRLDLRIDPPPDLAVEVDVTHGSLDRLAIYAALGVPEVWRLAENQLTFHLLQPDATFQVKGASSSFPFLSSSDLFKFIELDRQGNDQNAVDAQFRRWVQQRHKVGQQSQPN
jgi:Uma2 family endonuclease